MSKLNEIIVSQLPTQSEVLPCTAYLLDNGDGTHDRYVSDEDGILSKQSGGIKSIQPGDNITIDNTDPKNPIISSSTNETDPIFMASPSATITNSDITNWNNKLSSEVDTLESVVNRGNYSSKPISFTGVDNNVGSLWYNPSTLSYIFNSSNKQFVGVKNVLMGANTGAMLDTGGSNSIYGNNAGYALTTGSSNSLFGNAAGQGNQNGSTYMYSTFIGAYAGFKSVNGKYNSFVGYNSGGSNTGGDYNTFLGSSAGYYNISGFGNLFLGGGSAYIFKYGNSNVVIGQGSGGAKNKDISTPSNRNIYIGRLAGTGVIGDNNVFIGTQSGFVPGSGTTRTVSNKLIIHNRNGFITSEDDPAATTNTEDTFNTGLITGDFSERWIKFNGKFIVNGSYMPNATGDSTYTKNIVAKPDGTFGWEDKSVALNERLENLEGINYTWSPTNRTLTLYDNNGNQLSQVSLVSLDNEGTDIRYNASTLSLELYNADNELLDSIPVSSFIGSVGTQLQLNSNQLQLKDNQGNVLSTVSFVVSNIQGLQSALDGKLDKGGYTGTAQDLKNSIDGKLNKPTTTSTTTSYPYVVGEDGNGNSARLPAGDLGKNFFNSDLSNTTARNHKMNAGVTVNTLGNPHTLSGLPNKNADITNFRKVRVQNASGLDSVVDSKNLLTDGVTSMTDAEKDAWRSAQRKTGENYSLATPRIDFIAPFKLGKDIAGVQYLSCIGSNLLLNLSDCEVKLINTTTNVEYPVSVINTSASTTSQFSFGYNISTLPIGFYRVYVRNMLLTNIVDTVTFEVVNTIVKKDLSTLTWQKAVFDGTFTNSIASGNSVYRQPQSTSGETLGSSQLSVRKIAFLSDVFLNSAEAKGNWQIEFSVNYSAPFYGNYSGGSRFGIVDGNVVTAPTISADILYGQITLSASHRWRLFPSNNSDTVDGQTNGKYSIVKTGSVIRMYQIIAGTRIQIATHTITSNFGSLRFFFAANGNYSTSYDMAITVNIDNVNI